MIHSIKKLLMMGIMVTMVIQLACFYILVFHYPATLDQMLGTTGFFAPIPKEKHKVKVVSILVPCIASISSVLQLTPVAQIHVRQEVPKETKANLPKQKPKGHVDFCDELSYEERNKDGKTCSAVVDQLKLKDCRNVRNVMAKLGETKYFSLFKVITVISSISNLLAS